MIRRTIKFIFCNRWESRRLSSSTYIIDFFRLHVLWIEWDGLQAELIFSTVKKKWEIQTEFATKLNFALDCNDMKRRKVKSGCHPNQILHIYIYFFKSNQIKERKGRKKTVASYFFNRKIKNWWNKTVAIRISKAYTFKLRILY